MTDREAIDEFFKGIGYADECEVIQKPDGLFVKAPSCVFVPCEWRQAGEYVGEVQRLAKQHGAHPVLILHGTATIDELRTINGLLIRLGISDHWLGMKNCLNHNHIMAEYLQMVAEAEGKTFNELMIEGVTRRRK